ncbi:MAG: hypothetical protein R8G34_11395 [Paracoccaceae bacterium]|nr:hypothetical protein [Paracoccaceae bacterium]
MKRERDPTDRRGVGVHPTPYLSGTLGPLYRSAAGEIERIADTYSQKERSAAVKHFLDASSAYDLALDCEQTRSGQSCGSRHLALWARNGHLSVAFTSLAANRDGTGAGMP